jgi:carbonic anhydrase/acetyltransferase-like protein (isoleucine patch superfamily)
MSLYALDGVASELHESCWIAPGAALIGKVRLARDASVWFGAVLRGDNELIDIGEGSNIQEHCVLHTDMGFPLTVGRGCTIGHRAILHGCAIGDNTLIGMGATVLNGARVGRDCLIGAHALVTEGAVIPDGSLVIGAPGRVARPLRPEQIDSLKLSAERYIANAKRFAAGMAPVQR